MVRPAWSARTSDIAEFTDPRPVAPGASGDEPPNGRGPSPTGDPARPGGDRPVRPDFWGRHADYWGRNADYWGRYGRHGRRGHRRLRGPIRRSAGTRVVAGVCGGLSAATGIDVTLVRIGFVLLSLGSGVGILVYALAWLLLPLEGETSSIFSRAISDRGGIRLAIALIPLLVVVQVLVAAAHVGYLGSISVPIFLAAAAAILIRRNASEEERVWINHDLAPMFATGDGRRSRWTLLIRILAGALLGLGGLMVLILGHTSSANLRPVAGALLVIAAIVVVFGPWWLSLVRDLMAERQARALAEERTQIAAHVHDSVLQTLALIQRSADDPTHVVRLARAQERELRSWLFEGRPPGTAAGEATTLSEGVGAVQRQVEADHGVTVQTVVVGDCDLTDRLRALLDAAREATVNSAKWSGASQVSLYAEVEPGAVTCFVRDRGRGFDPDGVPGDRQGIAQSIRGRMSRLGGRAEVRSTPGDGTEIELSMPRVEAAKGARSHDR
jgi:signal transduction histidine kinase